MAGLVDQFGREIPSRLKAETGAIFVPSARDRWATYPSRGLTPVRLASILREADEGYPARQVEVFGELAEKDAHLASQLQLRKNAVLDLEYDVHPASDDAHAQKTCEFCREALMGLEDLDDLLLDLLDAVPQGWAMSELLWDVSSGQATLAGHQRVPQERTRWNDQGMPLLATDQAPQGIEFPLFKVVYHRNRARTGLDARAGLLRTCCWWWLFKNFSVKDWSAFAEAFGMPLRVAKYPSGMSPEDLEALRKAMYSLGSDGVAIISAATELEFKESNAGKGGSQSVYERLAGFCNDEMSKAVLGQTLTSQVGDSGSFAAAKVHDQVRRDLRDADAHNLAKSLRQQVLKPLVLFNFGPGAPVPWFKFDLEDPEDLVAKASQYQALSGMGLRIPQGHVYQVWGIPQPQGDEPVLGGPPAQTPQPSATKSLGSPAPAPASTAPALAGQAAIDNLAESALILAERALQGLDQDLRQAVADAADYDDLVKRVSALRPDAGPQILEELLARAAFAADLNGRLAAAGQGRG